MDAECADHMKDVIAFITARWKDDEDAAKAIMGWPGDHKPTEAEMEILGVNVIRLLFGVTDFAISQLQFMAMLTGVSMEKMMSVLGIQMARMVD
jgi:hypothetical protein